MKFHRVTSIARLILLVVTMGPAVLTAQERPEEEGLPRYTVIDLGTLGGTFSFAVGVSNKRSVNGFSTLPGDAQVRAFLWDEGRMKDLGTLGGPNSMSIFPLNDRDEIAGLAETSVPDPNGEDFCGFGTHLICLPFIWKRGRGMIALPTLGGNNGQATEINNKSQVVGGAENTTIDPSCAPPQFPEFKPVIWKNGHGRELPTLPGDPDGAAFAINDVGQVVGWSGNCSTTVHAVLWEDGVAVDLGNLGSMMNNIANDIDDHGQVTGHSGVDDTTYHAFLWRNGVMTDLGTLPGDFSSESSGVNEKGQVVGGSQDASGNGRAFLWQDGVLADLNTLIPADSPLFLVFAASINSHGEIAGAALEKSTGQLHAFLATPCNQQRNQSDGCRDEIAGTGALGVEKNPHASFAISDAVRRLLLERAPGSLYHPRFGSELGFRGKQ